MGSNFWIQFAINEAVSLVTEFIDNANIAPTLKTAFDEFIAAGEKVLAALKL